MENRSFIEELLEITKDYELRPWRYDEEDVLKEVHLLLKEYLEI